MHTDARFCSSCGTRLASDGPPAEHAVDPSPERRRLSVLFADLSGFAAMTERCEPEDVRTLVDSFLVMSRTAVERWGGRVDQFLGDGVMAVFGDPVAREDDAERAVRAAIEIRSATHDLPAPVSGPSASPLTSHTGVATGMTVTADGSNHLGVTAPMGSAVNLAARLQSLAAADDILVCSTTARLVDGVVTLTSLGERDLKGLEQRVPIHRVDHLRMAPTVRTLSALVGRTRELDRLSAAIDTLVADHHGAALIAIGEAGAGKTRLFHEAQRAAVARHGTVVHWFEGRGRSLGVSSPYAPIVEVIESMAGIDEHHDASELRSRLGRLARPIRSIATWPG